MGKLDVTVRDEMNRSVLFDHKTTGEDISDLDSPFWRQLVVKAQPSHYMLLEWQNRRKVDYAVWDVVRKPAIRPKEIAKRDLHAALDSGEYFGTSLTGEMGTELIATGRETTLLYAARLAWDCTQERPAWYFQRRMVPRLDSELLELAKEIWALGQEIITARAEDRWPRNGNACMNYDTPCKFLGICSGHDTNDSEKWRTKTYVHPELSQIHGGDLGIGGRDVLTTSSLATFLTCRQKYFKEYELGLDRVDEDDRESLIFGTIWHTAQEAFWLALKTQQEQQDVYDSNATAPSTEPGAVESAIRA